MKVCEEWNCSKRSKLMMLMCIAVVICILIRIVICSDASKWRSSCLLSWVDRLSMSLSELVVKGNDAHFAVFQLFDLVCHPVRHQGWPGTVVNVLSSTVPGTFPGGRAIHLSHKYMLCTYGLYLLVLTSRLIGSLMGSLIGWWFLYNALIYLLIHPFNRSETHSFVQRFIHLFRNSVIDHHTHHIMYIMIWWFMMCICVYIYI